VDDSRAPRDRVSPSASQDRVAEVLRPPTKGGGPRRAAGLAGIAQVDAAPRKVGAIVDRAVLAYREHFALVFVAAVLSALPGRLLAYFGSSIDDLFEPTVWGALLCDTLGSVWVGAIAARGLAFSVVGRSLTPRELLAFSPSELLGLLLISILAGIAVFFGLLTLIGWILVLWLLALAPAVFVLEPKPARGLRSLGALRRSSQLAAGGFGRWSAVMIFMLLLFSFIGWPEAVLADPINWDRLATTLGVSIGVAEALYTALSILPQAFVGGLGGFLFASLYLDQRARLEGVDLYIAVQELERS